MKQKLSEEGLLRRYLLGELSQEEEEKLEARFFADDDLFHLAESVEADLLADAARGELAPAERERVLSRLASSPQGRERFALARALNRAADTELGGAGAPATMRNVVPFPRPMFKRAFWGAAAVAASLLMVLLWSREQDTPPINPGDGHVVAGPTEPEAPQQPPVAPSAPQSPVPERVAEERPVTETVKPLVRTVLQLALATNRDGAVEGLHEKLHMKSNIDIVEIQLDVEGYESYESFDVALRNKEHNTIWQGSGLEPQPLNWASALVLEIPAETLAAGGRYEVQVQGRPAGEDAVKLSLEFDVVTSGTP